MLTSLLPFQVVDQILNWGRLSSARRLHAGYSIRQVCMYAYPDRVAAEALDETSTFAEVLRASTRAVATKITCQDFCSERRKLAKNCNSTYTSTVVLVCMPILADQTFSGLVRHTRRYGLDFDDRH